MESVIIVEQEKSEDKEEKVGVKHKPNYREHHRQMMEMFGRKLSQCKREWKCVKYGDVWEEAKSV